MPRQRRRRWSAEPQHRTQPRDLHPIRASHGHDHLLRVGRVWAMSTETKAVPRCVACGHGPTVECAECGVLFAFAPLLHARKLENGTEFFCPNGHSLNYGRNSENARLKRELAEAHERIEKARAQTE